MRICSASGLEKEIFLGFLLPLKCWHYVLYLTTFLPVLQLKMPVGITLCETLDVRVAFSHTNPVMEQPHCVTAWMLQLWAILSVAGRSLHRLIVKLVLWELSALNNRVLIWEGDRHLVAAICRNSFIPAWSSDNDIMFFFSFSKSSSLCPLSRSSWLMKDNYALLLPLFTSMLYWVTDKSSMFPCSSDRTSVSIRQNYWCAAVSVCLPPSKKKKKRSCCFTP